MQYQMSAKVEFFLIMSALTYKKKKHYSIGDRSMDVQDGYYEIG